MYYGMIYGAWYFNYLFQEMQTSLREFAYPGHFIMLQIFGLNNWLYLYFLKETLILTWTDLKDVFQEHLNFP